MINKTLKAEVIKVWAKCVLTQKQDSLNAYKFSNGLIMIGNSFLENMSDLQDFGDISTLISVERTGSEVDFTEKAILEMALVALREQDSYGLPIQHFLRLFVVPDRPLKSIQEFTK